MIILFYLEIDLYMPVSLQIEQRKTKTMYFIV